MNRKTINFLYLLLLIIVIIVIYVIAPTSEYPEIHCKHFFYGYPAGAPSTNDMIIRDAYALSSNDETKFADWVAYRLDKEIITGDVETKRNWKADPWLSADETLEPGDYKGASKSLHIDRGHQAPLASFKGTKYWADTNYLSNITPQKSELNQGPWRKLEGRARKLAKAGNTVYVMTGPLYEQTMRALPKSDEPHRVPSGYWKMILIQSGKTAKSIKSAGFIFSQDTPRNVNLTEHLCTINDIEQRSGLDFLRELPDEMEEKLESNRFEAWIKKCFD